MSGKQQDAILQCCQLGVQSCGGLMLHSGSKAESACSKNVLVRVLLASYCLLSYSARIKKSQIVAVHCLLMSIYAQPSKRLPPSASQPSSSSNLFMHCKDGKVFVP